MHSIRDIAIGGAATFVLAQVLPIQFKQLWCNWTEASDLAGRAYRGLESIRDSLGGFGLANAIGGRSGFYNAAKSAFLKSDKSLSFADDLFPLRYPDFEKELAREVGWTRGTIEYALTELMKQTANTGEDTRTQGTQAHAAMQAYLTQHVPVRLSELTRVLNRLKPLQNPWGVCARDCMRLCRGFIRVARIRPGEDKSPPAPFAPGRGPTTRRHRRAFPQACASTPATNLSH